MICIRYLWYVYDRLMIGIWYVCDRLMICTWSVSVYDMICICNCGRDYVNDAIDEEDADDGCIDDVGIDQVVCDSRYNPLSIQLPTQGGGGGEGTDTGGLPKKK